jgi:hypothetical protein
MCLCTREADTERQEAGCDFKRLGCDSPERDVLRDLVACEIAPLQNGFSGVRVTYQNVLPVFTIE